MAFIVTARKWRPQLFEEVVGQQHITTTLKNAIQNNRIGHAYIFAGPRGVGKTTTARILAKRLNCKNPKGGEPCNECDACNSFLKSQSLDIIEIDGASNRRIDEIRTLRESVKYAPTSGEYKVYIIDEVHMLTTESFNALLKTLEEPPEHTIFIFATTDIHKVPLTIISRCQRFDFRRIELNEIKSLLEKIAAAEKIKIDDESLTIIAKKADGALRDAESIFDQVVSFCGNEIDANILRQMLNLIDDEIYFQLSDSILTKDFKNAFEISERIYSNGWNFIDFINGLIEHFRNITTVIVADTTDFIEASEVNKKKYYDYADKFSEGDLLRILSFLSQAQNDLRLAQNQRLKVEISLTKLIGLEKSSTITEILSKVNSGEYTSEKKKSKITEKENESPSQEKSFQIKIDIPKNIPSKIKEKPNIPIKKDQPAINKEMNINEIISGWSSFVNYITKEKFTLGPLLEHSTPISVQNNVLNIQTTEKDDVTILNDSIDFLIKYLNSHYNSKLSLKITFCQLQMPKDEIEKNNFPINAEEIDIPLIEMIKKELGGKEIK